MKFKTIMLVTLLLLAVLTVSAVSANDDLTDTNEEVLMDASLDEIELIDDSDVISSSQEEIQKETENGTFTELQNKINAADTGSTVTLEKDYVYNDGFSTYGITISKSLTIDGQGYTIDANSQGRVFYISDSNIVLKNITFRNAHVEDAESGGAIYNDDGDNDGDNFTVYSCTFTDCSAMDGGAIYNGWGSYFTVDSCTFNKCSAGMDGGAIYNGWGSYFTVNSCTFNDCYAEACDGGAINNYEGADFTVDSCTFNNCSADRGGAIFFDEDGNVYNSEFINCHAVEVAAIFGGSNVNCTFTNCTADEDNWEDDDDDEFDYESLTASDFEINDELIYENAKFGYVNGDAINIWFDAPDGTFYVYVNNVLKFKEENGYATLFLTLKDLGISKSGTYTVVIKYVAPSPYNKKITILNKKYKIKFKDTINLKLTTAKVKKSAKKLVIKATLKINKKAVKGKQVTFKFNGKTYKAKTNKKGVAQITVKKAVLKKLKVGKKITYTAKYSTTTVKKTVKVKK